MGAAGVLPTDAREHVDGCHGCRPRWRRALEALELVADCARERQLPESLRRALEAIPASTPRPVTELMADAVREPVERVPIRGSNDLRSNHLYRVGDYELDLCLEDGALLGQLLPHSVTGDLSGLAGAYCLLYSEAGLRSAELGPNGDFELECVSPGVYDLAIEATGLRLVLKGICFDGAAGGR